MTLRRRFDIIAYRYFWSRIDRVLTAAHLPFSRRTVRIWTAASLLWSVIFVLRVLRVILT
jgi:hypothetical protein